MGLSIRDKKQENIAFGGDVNTLKVPHCDYDSFPGNLSKDISGLNKRWLSLSLFIIDSDNSICQSIQTIFRRKIK